MWRCGHGLYARNYCKTNEVLINRLRTENGYGRVGSPFPPQNPRRGAPSLRRLYSIASQLSVSLPHAVHRACGAAIFGCDGRCPTTGVEPDAFFAVRRTPVTRPPSTRFRNILSQQHEDDGLAVLVP